MKRNRLVMLAMLLFLAWEPVARASDVPVIAAASDLNYVLGKVADRFTGETGSRVRLSFGSSGNLKRLIEQGAPFELFLSADEDYVFQLADQGLTADRGQVYALGRLVLFAPRNSALAESPGLPAMEELVAAGKIRNFAIANPSHAPYGRAAREVLTNVSLWEKIEGLLVYGESAGQATLFAASGSAGGAIIPHSLALNPPVAARGSFWLIDESLHEPLRQRMVLLRRAGAEARRFYAFLQTAAVRELLRDHGFSSPTER